MQFTEKQIKAIKKEIKHIKYTISLKPEIGIVRLVAREEALQMILFAHNVEKDD